MPTYCCGVCSFWLAPYGALQLHGWCQHPEADEAYDVDGSGGLAPYRDGGGGGDLRTSEGMSCDRFVLISIRKKQTGQGAD
jgi:hypothetical protein